MAINIRWSPQAIADLERIIAYLENEWGDKVVREFVENLDKKLTSITLMPEMYPESEMKSGVRRCLLTKHNALYYRVINNEIEIEAIEIITIFDNRQDTNKLKL
jgi:plasmid stabilization system protein ParE